jgi:hypothetical protein
MTALSRLKPAATPDQLYPANGAYMARSDAQQLRLLGVPPMTVDTITTQLMGLINGRVAIRHQSGVTDEILSLLDRAGIEVAETTLAYEDGEQAERLADGIVEQGGKLFWPYPLREGRFSSDAHLVPLNLWQGLNSKSGLAELVPPENLAKRQVVQRRALSSQRFSAPVFLKAAGHIATGNGYAVRHCPEAGAWQDAIRWFLATDGFEQVVIEEALEVETCWCVNFAVWPDRVVPLGAAEQVFEAPGKQSGSVIDPSNAFPESGRALVEKIGAAAAARGFLGVAGLDIGLTKDGRLIVFDPNFRLNGCTGQVLLHDSAAARVGLPASVQINGRTRLPFGAMSRALKGPIDDGWFVPTRIIDGALHPLSDGVSLCTGFVLGADRHAAFQRSAELETLLDAAAPA